MSRTIQIGAQSSRQVVRKAAAQLARREPGRKLCPIFLVAVLILLMARAARGQALPAAEASPISTGFELPLTAGTLQYGVTASESLIWGYYGNSGIAESTSISGDLGYISHSSRDPFSAVIAGGHGWSTSSEPSYSFLTLGLSQVVGVGRWNFVLSDNLSYMPETATTGLSGIAGVGDLGVNPVQVGTDIGQGVLTNYSSRIDDTATVAIQRQLTGKTSLNGSGAYSVNQFVGNSSGPGLDYSSESGQGGITHQFSVRDTVGGNYSYSVVNYTGNAYGVAAPGLSTQTASMQFTHQFTRKLGLNASAGPQWTTLDFAPPTTILNWFADLAVAYKAKSSTMQASYVRSTNAGYGVIGGGLSDAASLSFGGKFFRVWNSALFVAYTRASSLPVARIPPYSFNTAIAGFQASRALAHSFSVYGSYTLEEQSTQGSASSAVDVFSGTTQVLGFGLTYSPTPIHFGSH